MPVVLFAPALLLISCGDDGEEPTANAGDFALVTAIINPDGQTRAFYLQRASTENQDHLDNSQATELSGATGAMIHTYDGSVFFSDYNNGRMEKWSIGESNNAEMVRSMSLTEVLYQGNATFLDENTAFVGGLSTDIIIFNPTTMQKTGTIDISSATMVGASTDFPAPGGTIAAESVAEMIIRGNTLFVALMPLTDVSTFTPGLSGCPIVVIDLDQVDASAQGNTSAVVKRIYDDRGSSTGAWGSGGGSYFMTLDENNDIYMICHNMWTGWRTVFDKPACILKIPSGSTEFDANYYFDLESAAKGNGSPVMNLEYYGDGKFLAAVLDPSAINPDDPYSYYIDPIYQWWSFDLNSQTAQIVSESYTRGASASVSYFEDGIGYIPFEDESESYVMKIDLETLAASKQFSTDGIPHLFSLD
ncbi:MAG: DUF4374 domain-containing protein [Cytophagales bacterium]|nr:DUF4374 domain-containing protein [Cytophagales bacterium]